MRQAVDLRRRLAEMALAGQNRISSLGRMASSVTVIHSAMLQRPLVSSNWLVQKTGLSEKIVNKALSNLKQLGEDNKNGLSVYRRDREEEPL